MCYIFEDRWIGCRERGFPLNDCTKIDHHKPCDRDDCPGQIQRYDYRTGACPDHVAKLSEARQKKMEEFNRQSEKRWKLNAKSLNASRRVDGVRPCDESDGMFSRFTFSFHDLLMLRSSGPPSSAVPSESRRQSDNTGCHQGPRRQKGPEDAQRGPQGPNGNAPAIDQRHGLSTSSTSSTRNPKPKVKKKPSLESSNACRQDSPGAHSAARPHDRTTRKACHFDADQSRLSRAECEVVETEKLFRSSVSLRVCAFWQAISHSSAMLQFCCIKKSKRQSISTSNTSHACAPSCASDAARNRVAPTFHLWIPFAYILAAEWPRHQQASWASVADPMRGRGLGEGIKINMRPTRHRRRHANIELRLDHGLSMARADHDDACAGARRATKRTWRHRPFAERGKGWLICSKTCHPADPSSYSLCCRDKEIGASDPEGTLCATLYTGQIRKQNMATYANVHRNVQKGQATTQLSVQIAQGVERTEV
ncbi:hypothetical protein IQ06DRAFT_369257 [Phaeosphaeriaceae sp. SRC1lsM3a]|nr:hypothetical protein IQ06DRAFT_369257 [Stagonospora sp. SRC1lsM3a]